MEGVFCVVSGLAVNPMDEAGTMLMKRTAVWLLVALSLSSVAVAQAGKYKAATGAASPSDVSGSLQGALSPDGITVTNPQGAPFAQVWLVKSVNAKPGTPAGEVAFPGLNTGALIGVIHLANEWSDFRGSVVKPGTYTLRYALHPEDGNHMGVSTYRDFLLLTPIAQDTFGTRDLLYDDLIRVSKLADASRPHPAILSIVPATGQSFPGIVTDDQNHVILEVKLQTSVAGQPKPLPIGLTLVGKSDAQ
jgi:hypothetical protein